MRKNRTMRAAALLLALTLITSCFVGGTMAKYTASTTVSSTASVAAWSVKINNSDIAKSEAVTFDLFGTGCIVDTVDGVADAHVIDGKIAPGTKGAKQINIVNESDVVVTYTITLDEVEEDGINGLTITTPTTLTGTLQAKGAANNANAATAELSWVWPFDATGNNDNAVGKAVSDYTPKVTATITVTQVD